MLMLILRFQSLDLRHVPMSEHLHKTLFVYITINLKCFSNNL